MVTISGEAAKAEVKAAAEEVARAVSGVFAVDNEMRVR
jgi:osmotically-inducible protein OsmY